MGDNIFSIYSTLNKWCRLLCCSSFNQPNPANCHSAMCIGSFVSWTFVEEFELCQQVDRIRIWHATQWYKIIRSVDQKLRVQCSSRCIWIFHYNFPIFRIRREKNIKFEFFRAVNTNVIKQRNSGLYIIWESIAMRLAYLVEKMELWLSRLSVRYTVHFELDGQLKTGSSCKMNRKKCGQ